jgi:DNA-binding MarR family transcriptional regulator
MARRGSRLFDRERGQLQEAKIRLSDLQKSVLQVLRRELRRHQRPGTAEGVPYPDLVRAVDADKASITNSVRQLLRKGLVLVTLPTGEWVRYVALTKEGEEQAQLLSKDERTHRGYKQRFVPEPR